MKNLTEYIQESIVSEGIFGFGGGSKHKRIEFGWNENEAHDVLGYIMFGYGTPKSEYFYKIANKEDKEKFYDKKGIYQKYLDALSHLHDVNAFKELSAIKPVSIYIPKADQPKIKKLNSKGKFSKLSTCGEELEYCSNPAKKLGKETGKAYTYNGWSCIVPYEQGFAVIFDEGERDQDVDGKGGVHFYVKFQKRSKKDGFK